MPDAKEVSSWFERNVKKKICDWKTQHPLAARFSLYVILFVLWFVPCILAFSWFDLFNTDANSARYMLSALVQSQAAILAIVVSLTLIAVQVTASAYSPRVIDIFKNAKKNPDFWILIGFYGFSIFYGLFLLKMVVGKEGAFVNQTPIFPSLHPIISFEHCVSFAYWLGAFTFIIIVPYIWNILAFLRPENIINLLASEITRDTLFPTKIKITPGKNLKPKEDPIQSIMDIVHGSIMKYDIATTRFGLKKVTERLTEIIDQDNQNYISSLFFSRFRSVGSHALSQFDEDTTIVVIENLGNFGKSTAEKKLEQVSMYAVHSIGEIGMTASEKDLEYATIGVVLHLKEAGKTALDGALKGTENAAFYLGEIGITFAKKESAHVSGEWVYSARVINVITNVVKSLLTIGIIALEKQCKRTILEATRGLAKNALLSDEIVKTTIQNYESELTEEDRESFQKFIKLYEAELERLQAAQETSE